MKIFDNVIVMPTPDQDFECVCKDGYDEHANGTCTDIDECSLGIHKCQTNLECINNSGDYACEKFCKEGFERSFGGNCRDINECATSIHNCSLQHFCVNNKGGFSCKE